MRGRGVGPWPASGLTFESFALVKGREERVGERSDPAGRNLVRERQERGCVPKREPACRLVGPK